MLSFYVVILCYHFLMLSLILSFGVILWCYYLFYVIIWWYHFSQFANVIIFVLSFFLVQDECYHLFYHLMLSFFVIISPLFSFSWKRDTLNNVLKWTQDKFEIDENSQWCGSKFSESRSGSRVLMAKTVKKYRRIRDYLASLDPDFFKIDKISEIFSEVTIWHVSRQYPHQADPCLISL